MLILGLVMMTSGINGEFEPNDSPQQALVLMEAPVSGTVDSSDEDFYYLAIKEGDMATISLEMINGEYVELKTVDEDGDPIYFSGISLDSMGEKDTDELQSIWGDEEHYFRVMGNGSYVLSAEIEEIPTHADEHSSKESAMKIKEGTYSGDVTSGDLFLDNGDEDYYVIKVPDGANLIVKLTFESAPSDEIYPMLNLEGEGEYEYFMDFMMISLNDVGDKGKAEHLNMGSEDEEYYLIITGDGEYTMEIEIENDDDNTVYNFMDTWCTGGTIICGGVLLFIIVSLLISILIVMLRKDKE